MMLRKLLAPVILILALLLSQFGPVLPSAAFGHATAQAAETWTVQQETYLRTAIAPHIGGTYYNDSGVWYLSQDTIHLETMQYGLITAEVSGFMQLFSDAIPDTPTPATGPYPIYTALSAIDAANGYGWQVYFDQWKGEGLIN